MKNSVSFDSESITVPKAKRHKIENQNESLSKPNGIMLSFSRYEISNKFIDSSTNTEGTMDDITTANNIILELIDDKVEKEKQIAELLELYNILQTQIEQLQSL